MCVAGFLSQEQASAERRRHDGPTYQNGSEPASAISEKAASDPNADELRATGYQHGREHDVALPPFKQRRQGQNAQREPKPAVTHYGILASASTVSKSIWFTITRMIRWRLKLPSLLGTRLRA